MKKSELKNKVKECIREVVLYYTGNVGNKLVEILYNKKNVNEFLIAKKMKLDINQVRNMLYKLVNKNLISFLRKRDRRTKWYIYYWTFREDKILEELKNLKLRKIKEIEGQIRSKEHTNFYICPNKCITMKEDTALLYNFFCPECGELLKPLDTKQEVDKLKKEKEKLIKELENIDKIIYFYKQEKNKIKEKKKIKKKKKRKKRKK